MNPEYFNKTTQYRRTTKIFQLTWYSLTGRIFSWLRWQGSLLPFQHPFERRTITCQPSQWLLKQPWSPDEHLSSQVLTLRASTSTEMLFFFLLAKKIHVSYFWQSAYHYKISHNYEPTIMASWENYFLWLESKKCMTANTPSINKQQQAWGKVRGQTERLLYRLQEKNCVSQ